MNGMTIGPLGDIYTCVGARVYAGNIRRQSLADIWHNSPVWQETASLTLGALPGVRRGIAAVLRSLSRRSGV